jgi:hypothetical protein
MAVFPSGPGPSTMVSEKMPMIVNSRYWKSYTLHRYDCRDRKVSFGENEVCNEAMDDAGEIRLCSVERNLRRMRRGMSILKERHGTTGIWTLTN